MPPPARPNTTNTTIAVKKAALAGAVACGAATVAYCAYSVLSPELQRRRIEAARKRRLRLYVVRALAERTAAAPRRFGALVDASGRVNTATLRALFDEFDRDGSGAIDAAEARALLAGLRLMGGGDGEEEGGGNGGAGASGSGGSGGSGGTDLGRDAVDVWFAVRSSAGGERQHGKGCSWGQSAVAAQEGECSNGL